MLSVIMCAQPLRAQEAEAVPGLLATVSTGSNDTLSLRIYFPKDIKLYYRFFADNILSLEEFIIRYDRYFHGRPIVISSSASPEGYAEGNRSLVENRAAALKEQLKLRLDIPDSLYIIGTYTTEYPGRTVHPEEYPYLRYAEAVAVAGEDLLLSPAPEAVTEPEPETPAAEPGTDGQIEEPRMSEPSAVPAPVSESNTESKTKSKKKVRPDFIRKPLFAVKTNLLFDVATAVNAEIEVPIARRFSVAGELIFPNWVDRTTNTYCLQASLKTVEGRVWLGNRTVREKLTGHFLGAYYTWGDFDYQPFREDGFRCYNGWAAGVSYGFAHPINRAGTLRMEYSIGIGYAFGDYCRYQREADGTIIASKEEWHYNASFFPIPTRAKVSFVWMICYRQKIK